MQQPKASAGEKSLSEKELSARERGRRSLQGYIEYVDPRFQENMPPHIPFLCEKLEGAARYAETGEGTPILVIAIPPGHLKTTLVSDHFVAWFHGRNPGKRVINTSYSGTLADDSSARVRDTIANSEEYDALFGKKATFYIDDDGAPVNVDIERDTSAKGKWKITGDAGEHFAVGFGGTVTGRRAHLIIVDDPYASRADAESQTIQKSVITFFRSTLYSRRQKNCAIVIIMQLWNKKDLVGWLKRVTDPEDEDYIPDFPPVDFVFLPALAMQNDPLGRPLGKALWPEFQDEKELQGTRAVLGDHFFNSQYQQQQTDQEGTIFKKIWFPSSRKMPSLYRIQYWDTAEKDKQENDFWAGGTFDVTMYGIQIQDIEYEKMTTDVGMERIYSFYDEYNTEEEPVAVVWIEEKSSGGPLLSIMKSNERVIPVDGVTPKGDKISRANSITGVCKNRRVQLLAGQPWIRTFLEEMTAFPNGEHDDLTDMVVGGVSKLTHGGHIRIDDLRRQAEQRISEANRNSHLPPTHEDRRREVFGRPQGRNRGGAMRQPPSAGHV